MRYEIIATHKQSRKRHSIGVSANTGALVMMATPNLNGTWAFKNAVATTEAIIGGDKVAYDGGDIIRPIEYEWRIEESPR